MTAITSSRNFGWAFACCVGILSVAAQTFAAPPQRLSREALLDKIRGGWAGQMIGVAYGAKTEFKSNAKIGDWDLPWKPGMLENTIHQDDLYVEMTFAKVMDDQGLNATCEQFGEAFKDSKYQLWHANAGARRVLNQGIKAPLSGHPKYNFHANDIDFQIEADFIGLMETGQSHTMTHSADLLGRLCVTGMCGNPSPRAALRSQNQRASVGGAARWARFTAPAGARTLSAPARSTCEFAHAGFARGQVPRHGPDPPYPQSRPVLFGHWFGRDLDHQRPRQRPSRDHHRQYERRQRQRDADGWLSGVGETRGPAWRAAGGESIKVLDPFSGGAWTGSSSRASSCRR